MYAHLAPPDGHHWWHLDLFEVDEGDALAIRRLFAQVQQYPPSFVGPLIVTCLRHVGAWIQGDQRDWMRLEFHSTHQGALLETATRFCHKFQAELELK